MIKQNIKKSMLESFADFELVDKSELATKKQAGNALMESMYPNEVHYNVICDGCGMSPIIGPRYKCTVLKNFDFFEVMPVQLNLEDADWLLHSRERALQILWVRLEIQEILDFRLFTVELTPPDLHFRRDFPVIHWLRVLVEWNPLRLFLFYYRGPGAIVVGLWMKFESLPLLFQYFLNFLRFPILECLVFPIDAQSLEFHVNL